jgi:hypothetical protein
VRRSVQRKKEEVFVLQSYEWVAKHKWLLLDRRFLYQSKRDNETQKGPGLVILSNTLTRSVQVRYPASMPSGFLSVRTNRAASDIVAGAASNSVRWSPLGSTTSVAF